MSPTEIKNLAIQFAQRSEQLGSIRVNGPFDAKKQEGKLTIARARQVTIEGQTREFRGRHFCPRCGSSVFARYKDEIEVHLGSLDAPDQLTPTYECWTVRRESWLPPLPLVRRHERERETSGPSED